MSGMRLELRLAFECPVCKELLDEHEHYVIKPKISEEGSKVVLKSLVLHGKVCVTMKGKYGRVISRETYLT